MNLHIFAYGSLMFPEIWKQVVRGQYRSAPGSAAGYARFAVAGETYPGMVSAANARVEGIVYFDVSPQDVAALDAFEGNEYRRDTVNVMLDSGARLAAGAYIYLLPSRLSKSPWHPATFDKQAFLQTYCGALSGAGKPV